MQEEQADEKDQLLHLEEERAEEGVRIRVDVRARLG